MTTFDTLFDVEEVTTINPIIDALRVPFNPEICRKVKRFGFEYEMFPKYWRDDDIEVSDDDVWDEYHEQCNCRDCLHERRRERVEELMEEGTNGPQGLKNRAYAAGLTSDTDQHDYHCDCSDCDYERSYPLLTAQNDCSVAVEFVSRIIDLDNFDDAHRDISKWVAIMQQWADEGKWMPDGVTNNGNHVHVSKEAFWTGVQNVAARHIDALYAVFDWTDVADGGCGRIRDYNVKPSHHGQMGGWLSNRDDTFEHRLWNTPCDPQRLWAHLGLSIAITRWAFAIAEAKPGFTFWDGNRGDEWGYGCRMTDQTYETLHLHLREIAVAVRSYIPDNPCFDGARTLILNLS